MEKPTLPKGTRDFGPAVMAKRQFILASITSVFKKFGFLPLETPAMENLSTLTGKYGDEGDQLLFRILNSGDFLKEYRLRAIIPSAITKPAAETLFKFLPTKEEFIDVTNVYVKKVSHKMFLLPC